MRVLDKYIKYGYIINIMFKKILLDETPIMDVYRNIFYSYGYQSFGKNIYVIPYYFLSKNIDTKSIVMTKFYRNIEKKRIINKHYVRTHNILDGIRIAKGLGYNVGRDPRYGLPCVILGVSKIVKIFNPLSTKKYLDLRKKISEYFDIPLNSVGILRSSLTGMDMKESNIDIGIFGVKHCSPVINNFEKFTDLMGKKNTVRINRHVNLLPKRLDGIKSWLKKKQWYSFNYSGKSVDFHFIKKGSEMNTYRLINNFGNSKIKIKILDCRDSFYAPFSYKIKILYPKKYSNMTAYLITYSRFFSGLFKKNELLNFQGRIEENTLDDKKVITTYIDEI